MIVESKQMVIKLRHRGFLPVLEAAGTHIACLHGCIWITEDGCTDDIVLEIGETYEISRPGRAVVQALRDSVVGLRTSEAPGIPVRVAAWLKNVAGARGFHASSTSLSTS